MKRRDMKLLLEERFERIALLETRIDTMDQLVEGYRAREQAIFETLNTAKENAAKILEQANAQGAQLRVEAEATLMEAERVRDRARAEAEALLADAIHTANTLKTEAERKGVELSASVKADSERMLRDAEIIKREYEEMVDSFNAMLEQNASELEITAARFAEFVKNRKIDRTETRLDGNAFYKSVGELSDADLPDASGDPSLLMQNIYRIQNRPLPEDRQDSSARESEEQVSDAAEAQAQTQTDGNADAAPEFPMVDGNGADARQSAEPYSEAAWSNEAQQSESEPQAEFTRVFDDAYHASNFIVQSDSCPVSQEDVERAFEAALADNSTASAAIPEASMLLAGTNSSEPLADAVRAFDEYFDGTFEPSGKPAQDAAAVDRAEASPAPTAAPEPYSEQAWSQNVYASEHEPQAEGALFGEPNAYVPEVARAEAEHQDKPVSGNDVDRALDDYLSQIGSFTPASPAPTAAPEPYSEQAWSQNVYASEHEPQAEGGLFGEPNAFVPEVARTERRGMRRKRRLPLRPPKPSPPTRRSTRLTTICAQIQLVCTRRARAQPQRILQRRSRILHRHGRRGASTQANKSRRRRARLFGEAERLCAGVRADERRGWPEAETSFEAAESRSPPMRRSTRLTTILRRFNSSAPASRLRQRSGCCNGAVFCAGMVAKRAFASEQEPQAEGRFPSFRPRADRRRRSGPQRPRRAVINDYGEDPRMGTGTRSRTSKTFRQFPALWGNRSAVVKKSPWTTCSTKSSRPEIDRPTHEFKLRRHAHELEEHRSASN